MCKHTEPDLLTERVTMRLAIVFSILATFITPTIAMAECNWSRGHEVTMSCADGMTWDADSASCIPTATS